MNECRRAHGKGLAVARPFLLFWRYSVDKPFKNIDEQLDILRSRNLKIDDEREAREALTIYGYYEIVNGYKSFILESDDSDNFKADETFSHLYSLYQLDKDIRNGVLSATLEVELSLRTAIAYTIAEDFGEKQIDYLKPKNYRRGHKRQNSNRYPLYQLLDKLNNIANDDVEPYKHYRENHGNIPPWILLKGTSFGNLVNFYKLLKPKQKDKVISICTGLPKQFITDSTKSMFAQALRLIHSYRNRAAHSGRLFSYRSQNIMEYNEPLHEKIMEITKEEYNDGVGQTGLFTLQNILGIFKNERSGFLFEFNVYYSIGYHCQFYPSDLDLLCEQTMINKTDMLRGIEKYSK